MPTTHPCSRSRNVYQRGQWSLVGVLVSLAIVAILSAWYYGKILKPQTGSHNGAPAAEQQAYGAACSEYQSQLNMAVTMYKQDHNEQAPTSFEQLKKYGATDDIIRAPGCQFQLDPSTGNVADIGRGQAAPNAPPIVLGGASSPSGVPAASNGPVRGPGGITLPPSSGSIPANSGGGDGSE